MSSGRALVLISSLVVAAGCTSLLGDFSVSATGGSDTDGGGADAGSSDGQATDGSGSDTGTTDGSAPDAGGWNCAFFPPRKLLDYTDSLGNRTRTSDFAVNHMANLSDPRALVVFQPSSGSNDIRSMSFRTKNTSDTVQLETTPSARPIVIGRSGGAVYLFVEEHPQSVPNGAVSVYRVDDQSNGALQNGATKSPSPVFPLPGNSFNNRYAGAVIDNSGNFNIALGAQSPTVNGGWDLYMIPNVSFQSTISTLPPPFATVNVGNDLSLDGSSVFRASNHVYLLAPGIDPTNPSTITQLEFGLGQTSPGNQRPFYPGKLFPILFRPTGTGQLDVGVAMPAADAAAQPFDVFFGRIDETHAMTFNPTSDLHPLSLFDDPDKSPVGQQMGCFATFPGTMMFVGRGQTPQSTGANVFMFDIPTATPRFMAAGTGQNLLVGDSKFSRCAMDFAGPSAGGAQNWDVVWTEPGDANGTYDEVWYGQLYCQPK